jgi:hypothetical protein
VRISRIIETKDGTTTLEIDTSVSEGERLPTHQEYEIIRDLLGISEDIPE